MRSKNAPNLFTRIVQHEDWLSLLIAFLIILLSVVGILGPNGLKISF